MTAQAGDTLSFSPAAQKADLRRRARRLRAAIGAAQRRRCAQRAATHLLRWLRQRRPRHVAVYLACASELTTAPLIAALQRRHCQVWVPAVTGEQAMRFLLLRPGATLRSDRAGMPRPLQNAPRRSAMQMDLIVLPLLAFDGRGRRLGSGRGYYDRALAGPRRRRPLLVGYAYAAQELKALPAEPWDVRLDAVATELGVRPCA